jgi:hypothetical protein
MSSKPMAARSRIKLRTRADGACVHAPAATPDGVSKKRGRRQPQGEDFQVALDLPPSPPIMDRELRAIEVLLGPELQDLLAGDATDSSEK